jgi:hypothetical protein
MARTPITERLSRYLDREAERRYEQALTDLADERNLRAAQKLSEFAFYVADLPDDDVRLVRLRLLQAPYGAEFVATGEASRFVSRIGLDLGTDEQSPEVLLDMLVDIESRGVGLNVAAGAAPVDDRACRAALRSGVVGR